MFELLAALIILSCLFVGAALFGATMSLLYYAVTGLIVGALARLMIPGPQQLGLLPTALFGVAGAMGGGVIARALHLGNLLQLAASVLCAVGLLLAFGHGKRR